VADQQTAGNGGERRIVTLPEHIDISNARSVAEELQATFDTGVTVVIADLTGTMTCSAAGVHELDLACQRAAARSIDLRLVIPPGPALRVFELTGHDRWLPIYPDMAAALAEQDPALAGRAQEEVPVTPAFLGAVALIYDVKASVRHPAKHALAPGVVVVAGHVSFNDLAARGGQAARGKSLEGGVNVPLIHFLDRHVEDPAGSHRLPKVRQHRRVVLGRYVLQRVDRHDGVELALMRKVLRAAVLERTARFRALA
jgi:anti-anti-sigma factor